MNIYYCIALLLFASCGTKQEKASLSVNLFEAQLAADAKGAHYAGWDTVYFAASQDSIAYVVAPEPLLTEWNIAAFKTSQTDRDDQRIVTVRLNAYAERAMGTFCSEASNLKKPLGLRIGQRWVNFTPLLNPISDRTALRGFTATEVEQLQRYIDER